MHDKIKQRGIEFIKVHHHGSSTQEIHTTDTKEGALVQPLSTQVGGIHDSHYDASWSGGDHDCADPPEDETSK